MTEREIEVKKQVSKFFKTAEQRAKRDTCALCGKVCSGFANSHSIPRFIIKRIAVEGKLLTFNDIVGLLNKRNGINNSWTFHIICSECENKYFSSYEEEVSLLSEPNNKMMSEIALKNALLLLSKYRVDSETNSEAIKVGAFVGETDVLPIMNALDIKNMDFEIRRSKKIIDKNLKSGYQLIYYKKLDWIAPIAFQSALCIYKNIDGTILNQIYSESDKNRMQFLHICVFPLSDSTIVTVFTHKDDRKNILFERQFLKLADDNKLEYINYLIFKYTEHVLLSPQIDPLVLNSDKLIDLCEETNGNEFGYGQNILPNEIPNFLSQEFALPKQEDSK